MHPFLRLPNLAERRFAYVAACLLLWFAPAQAADPQSPAVAPAPVEGPSMAPSAAREFRDLSEEKIGRIISTKEPSLTDFLSQDNLTYIPLPAFAYNRNESFYVGALMPVLRANPKGEIDDIFAPQYLFNEFVGNSVTLNYYGYRSDTVQYRAIVNYAEKVQKNFDFAYKDLGAGGGRYILGGQANFFKNPFSRFFGIGNAAQLSNESNYTSRETNVNAYIGLNLTPDFSILLTQRFRDVRLENGIIPTLPQTTVKFAATSGVEGAQILGTKLTFLYDTRDSQLTPIKGTYATFSVEFNSNVQHDEPNRWVRFVLDARHLYPHDNDSKVLVVRALFDGVVRTDQSPQRAIPFYELPTLGGETTLRAFGLNRFFSNQAVVFNVEERIRIMQRKFFDHSIDLEVAPTLDVGRVMNLEQRDFTFKDFQVNPGLGIRVMAKPHVVGRLDIAYGKDGGNAFVGLDYPF